VRILVTGGRDHENYEQVRDVLEGVICEFGLMYDDVYQMPESTKFTIIHGGATGADTHADNWCTVNWLQPEVYKVTKEDWNRLGRAAGMIRNQEMLDTGIDLVLAFPTKKSKGTWGMVNIARKAGVEVRVFEEKD
jgi:hypothetical protein